MRLLIDSGATKTEFLLKREDNKITRFLSDGINVNYVSDEFIFSQIMHFISALDDINYREIQHITYYGAGCLNPLNSQRVISILESIFPNTTIRVYSDLMAVCHALCGTEPGYIGILGTGAASCKYDGKEIVDRAPSLGYILGDEGSGTHLGKLFLQHYLKGTLPDKVAQHFEDHFNLVPDMVIPRLYRGNNPQTFLSSIPIFLAKEIQNAEISNLILDAFNIYFINQKNYYKAESIAWNISGSIGFYFSDLLKESAQMNGMTINQIIQSPLHKLIDTI